MKYLYLIFFFTLSAVNAQCELRNLVPFDFGSSKFVASENAQKLDLIYPKYKNYESPSEWKKEKYMKNDSVYFSQLAIDVRTDECFSGRINYMSLNFGDDKLYQVRISSQFGGDQLLQAKSACAKWVDILKSDFPVVEDFNERDKKTNEQINVGSKLTPKNQQNLTRPKFATVTYRPFYKKSNDGNNQVTKEVNYYLVEVKLVDLKDSKYTVEGYY